MLEGSWSKMAPSSSKFVGRKTRPSVSRLSTVSTAKTAEDFAALYPEFETFRETRADFDSEGLFLNDHLADVFGLV